MKRNMVYRLAAAALAGALALGLTACGEEKTVSSSAASAPVSSAAEATPHAGAHPRTHAGAYAHPGPHGHAHTGAGEQPAGGGL